MIAVFRFVLEPLSVRVDTWSMSIRSTSSTRTKTYTFGDVFADSIRVYADKIIEVLEKEQLSNVSNSDPGLGKNKTCEELATDSKDWFRRAYGG